MRIEHAESGRVIDAVPGARDERPTRVTRRRPWMLRAIALALLLAAGAWALYANVLASRPATDMNMRVTSGSAAFPVTLALPERGPITGTVTYTGSVAPFNEEDIFPRVTGRIVEMPVYPGDAVRAGQVVARLDDVELGSRAREAEAGAAAARASVAQMEAEVAAARSGVDQMQKEVAMATAEVAAARDGVAQMEKELAMVEAEAGYQEQVSVREERLYQSGAVSRQDVENARALIASARAKVAAARAKVSQARAMVTAAEAKLEAARARLDQSKAMETSARRKRDAMAAMSAQAQATQRTAEVVRDYVVIRAPSDGYVVKRLVAPGVLVQPGMAILKTTQIDRVRLQANVGERDLASIKVGSPVRVTTTAGQSTAARVTSVFPFVDQGPRTAVVEAIVDNANRRLLPGQYVTMQFVTGERPDALSVPRSSVVRLGGKASLWVVLNDRAERREVATGFENADRVEVTRGLTGTERVIVAGHEGLYAGARVAEAKGHGTPGASPSAPAKSEAPASPPMKDMPAQPKGGQHGGH